MGAPPSTQGQFGHDFKVLSVRDDGQVALTVNGIVGDVAVNGQVGHWVSTDGVASLTRQLLDVVARLADIAGYGGSWEAGLAVTDLLGARPYRDDGLRTRMYGSSYPDAEYVGTTGTTSGELTDHPEAVLARLTQPLLRVLGEERRLVSPPG